MPLLLQLATNKDQCPAESNYHNCCVLLCEKWHFSLCAAGHRTHAHSFARANWFCSIWPTVSSFFPLETVGRVRWKSTKWKKRVVNCSFLALFLLLSQSVIHNFVCVSVCMYRIAICKRQQTPQIDELVYLFLSDWTTVSSRLFDREIINMSALTLEQQQHLCGFGTTQKEFR